jgi:sigma-B regulation protein RsbU (phosphoserine phosphatase)
MPKTAQYTRMERLLLDAARRFNSTLEYEELIKMVLQLVLKAVNSEAALVFRIDHTRTNMKIRYMKASDCEMKVIYHELGQGVVGWVSQYRETILLNDVSEDARCEPASMVLDGLEIRSILSIPLIGKGQMIGVLEAINKIDGPFTDGNLDILTGLANQIAVAIDNAHLYREMKREANERRTLYEVGKKLASPLHLDELLNEILESLKQVVAYDAGGIFLIDPGSGDVKSITTIGYLPAKEDQLQLKIGQGLVGYVANSGDAVIVPDVSRDSRYIQANPSTKSEIVAPIKVDDRVIGVINLESEELNMYEQRTLALLDAFASQAAVSIERARLHESLLEGEKLEEQLNIARQIQRSFLPETNPVIAGYDVSGTNISSMQVGGDYYGFIDIVEGHLGIAIADVSGKGMPAALIMASFRASLIAEIRNNYSIRTICSKVNSLLCESLESGNFVTAVYGVLDFKNHVLTFANCGHNLPVLLRADGSVEYLQEGGPVLGVSKSSVYEERPVMVNPGDVCVLYTDGVTEVFSAEGEEFGLDRLVEIIRTNREKTAAEIQDTLLKAVYDFSSPEHTFDDLTMVIIRRLTS